MHHRVSLGKEFLHQIFLAYILNICRQEKVFGVTLSLSPRLQNVKSSHFSGVTKTWLTFEMQFY